MKKILTALAAASVLAAASTAAQAQSQNFNVTVNLTSACTLSVPTDVAFTYTSFGGAAVATPGTFNVRCTNLLPYTLALDAGSGTVIGLNYTVALSSAGGTGNGNNQGYSITGGMVGGQSGNCATAGGACSGTDVRTLTVSF